MSETEYELKYVFSNTIAHSLVEWLALRCKPDPQYAEGAVSSVYFDTLQWDFLREKINSDYLKTKIRVRWYSNMRGDEFSPCSWLEAKLKIGSSRDKKRIQLDYDGQFLSQKKLETRFWDDLSRSIAPLGVPLPGPLVPVFEIRYHRYRFIEPTTGTRICIDCNISAPRSNSLVLRSIAPVVLPDGVFEVKGSRNTLPEFIQQMTALGCRKGSFSKYLNCCTALTGTVL